MVQQTMEQLVALRAVRRPPFGRSFGVVR